MSGRSIVFGTELRRRRTEAGLSLTDLAKLVHYSKSHLSKVETGGKPSSIDLARQCDAVLSCDGELSRLATSPTVDASVYPDTEAGEVWMLILDEHGESVFRAVPRRDVLAAGIVGLAGFVVGSRAIGTHRTSVPTHGSPPGATNIASFRTLFDELRALGQRISPVAMVPMLVPQTHALRAIARDARPTDRDAALTLAARFAEYTGWMAQEAGDDGQALWWTDRAVTFASAGGDRDMASYALVRRALITLYRHDATETVRLAQLAQAGTGTPRIRGLAAQREAQGHAMAGDERACLRAIERAATLLSARTDDGTGPVIGTSTVTDPVGVATGWCLFDLGQPARAAEVLRRELDRIPAHAYRARARFGARLVLALAASGEPIEACAVAGPVLDAYEQTDSATVRTDLRTLARTLNRWHTLPEVRDVRLRLTAALHTGTAR